MQKLKKLNNKQERLILNKDYSFNKKIYKKLNDSCKELNTILAKDKDIDLDTLEDFIDKLNNKTY